MGENWCTDGEDQQKYTNLENNLVAVSGFLSKVNEDFEMKGTKTFFKNKTHTRSHRMNFILIASSKVSGFKS